MVFTRRYMQSRDFRWKICGTHTSKGACFALSAWWIIQTEKPVSGSFWSWLGASDYATGQYQKPEQVEPFQEASNWRSYAANAGDVVTRIHTGMADQAFAIDESDDNYVLNAKFSCVAKIIETNSTLRTERKGEYVKTYDLNQFKYDRNRDGALEKWGSKLSETSGYKFITIKGVRPQSTDKDFNHAIAVFTGDCTFYIFDPNIGEFSANTLTDFQGDLKAIFGEHYKLLCYSAHYASFEY